MKRSGTSSHCRLCLRTGCACWGSRSKEGRMMELCWGHKGRWDPMLVYCSPLSFNNTDFHSLHYNALRCTTVSLNLSSHSRKYQTCLRCVLQMTPLHWWDNPLRCYLPYCPHISFTHCTLISSSHSFPSFIYSAEKIYEWSDAASIKRTEKPHHPKKTTPGNQHCAVDEYIFLL